ncbi:unnamed protein product, partial [Brassica rapa subsp. trilocularis]
MILGVRSLPSLLMSPHETGHFCYTEEIDGPSKDYRTRTEHNTHAIQPKAISAVDRSSSHGTSTTDQHEPLSVLQPGSPLDPVISFKIVLEPQSPTRSSSRLWCNNLECDGANRATVEARVRYYTDYCRQLGVVNP